MKERRKAIKHYTENEIGKDEGKNPRDICNTFQPFISNKTVENNPISPNTDGNVTENDAVTVANYNNNNNDFINVSSRLLR